MTTFLKLIYFIILSKIIDIYLKQNNSKKYEYNKTKKIVFLFLIYDCINHEDIWLKFFENIDTSKYSIFIHSKTKPTLSPFLKNKLISNIKTKWGGMSIVKVQNLLLEKAITNTENYKFIFISGACIPVKNFNYIYNELTQNSYSYFNLFSNNSVFPRCNPILKHMEKDKILKAHQWCILNRAHANIILKDKRYIEWFKNIFAPDELCYINILSYHNKLDSIYLTQNVKTGGTTFTNWKKQETLLKNYDIIDYEQLMIIKNSNRLFARKFNKDCKVLLSNEIEIPLYDVLTNSIYNVSIL